MTTDGYLVHVSAHHESRENPCNVVARDEDMSLYMSATRIWDIPAGEIVSGGSRTGAESFGMTMTLDREGNFEIKLHGDTLKGSDTESLDTLKRITGSLKTCEVTVHDGS